MTKRINPTTAREILASCGIEIDADYHALPNTSFDALMAEADRLSYRRPKGANGSRGRYFHYMLQRRARGQI